MGKLPKLTRGIIGPPVRTGRSGAPETKYLSESAGTVRFIVRPPLRQQQVFFDQEELPTQVTPRFDEEYWQAPGVQSLPRSQFVVPDVDENHGAPLGGFRLEEDYALDLPRYLSFTGKQPAPVDEELGFTVASLGLDEDGYLTGAVPLPRGLQPAPVDEELGFTAAFGLDEDWQITGAVPLPRGLQPAPDDESWITPPTPFGLDDEYWFEPWVTRYVVNPGAAYAIQDDKDVWVLFVPPATPTAGIYKPTYRPRRGR